MWYGVAGDKCVSPGSNFVDPQLWAEHMRREGAIVLDKTDHSNDSDKGAPEFLVSFRGETKGIVFYKRKQFCNSMASLMKTIGMMPWQFREHIVPEIKRPVGK